ncbi:MAG: hypothetical protein LC663_03800 [Actinobacteria bacterium]|nr:hypothetical protein [Actinomycetota bacterium]
MNIDTIGSDRGAVASPTFYERLAKRGIPPLPFTEPAPELEQAEWLIGMWEESRRAFATATTPEMTRDAAAIWRWRFSWGGRAIACVGGDEDPTLILTFDPVERCWVLVTMEFGVLFEIARTPSWHESELVFEQDRPVIGEPVKLRHRLVREGVDAYRWANDEWLDGKWIPIDEHRYRRLE